MAWRLGFATLLVPGIIIVIVAMGGIFLQDSRSGEATQPSIGITAEAVLESPSGDPMGTVTLRQGAAGVLIMAEMTGLTPGGHAFVIHETGACTPDFGAAGDHFNPAETEHGFIHPAWKRGESVGAHGGDLPNIYAAADGSARADFFTAGVTLDTGQRHSVFDADGSALIVHEHPDAYGPEESDTGRRVACGVIDRSQESAG